MNNIVIAVLPVLLFGGICAMLTRPRFAAFAARIAWICVISIVAAVHLGVGLSVQDSALIIALMPVTAYLPLIIAIFILSRGAAGNFFAVSLALLAAVTAGLVRKLCAYAFWALNLSAVWQGVACAAVVAVVCAVAAAVVFVFLRKIFLAADITCSDEGVLAWFQCADCGQVITVSVVYPHTVPAGAEEIVLEELPYDGDLELIAADAENQIAANTVYTFAATCEDAGYTIYRCAVCGDVQIEVIARLGHDYVYSLEYDEEEGTYTFVAVCANDESHTFSIVLDEESDLTIVENRPATCEAEGYTIYQYEYEGETYTVTVTLPVTEHQLNGEDMFYDDEHVYAVDNEYIFQTGNSAPACSSESFGQGYFYCDHCGQVIVINVRLPHERPEVAQNVTWDELPYDTIEEVVADASSLIANNTIYTLNATCENVGYVVYRCAVCGEVQYEVLEVLGHDYVVTVSATPDASNTGLAVITCANGCGLNIEVSLPVLGSEDYEVVTISEASCNSVGVDRYTYVYNNAGEDIIITFDVVTPMTGHELGDQIYTWEYEGMLYTAHLCGDCNRLIVESITPVE